MTMCFKCQIKQDGATDAFSLLWRGLWFTVKTLYIQKRDQVDDNINHHYIYHGYAWYELLLHIKLKNERHKFPLTETCKKCQSNMNMLRYVETTTLSAK